MSEKDLDTTIKVSVDATGVETGTTRIKRSLSDMGKAASEVGKSTGEIGDGGDAAAKKIEAATRRISNEFKRLQVDAESMGKTLSEKIVIKANAYGVPLEAISAQRAALKQFEDAQRAANPAMVQFQKLADASGQSVKGLSAALRQVPSQFTDIVVSLQGGQAPLTVLLQQGGQLKDVFGGVGNAARALGGYVLGLINPLTVAAAVVGTLGYAYYKGSKEADAFRLALVTSGNQAGTTTGALADMAKNISAVSGTTGAAAEALAQFAASGAVGAAGLEKFTVAALNFEKYTGTAIAETVKNFKALGDDPLKASVRLSESTNFLTTSLYEQIKALEQQGRTIEAANLAQTAFADTINSRANEMKANLGYIGRGWLAIKAAVSGAGDAIAGIDRPKTTGAEIARVQKEIAEYSNNSKGGLTGFEKIRVEMLQKELETLNRIALKEQDRATNAAQQALEMENRIAADKIRETLLSKSVKMEREIAQTRATLVRDGADRLEIEKAILAVREKYKEKKQPKVGDEFASQREAAKEWAGYMERFGNMAAKSTAKVEGLNKAQAELVKYLSSTAYTQMDEPARQLALQSAYAAIAIEQQADATKALNKAQEALEKERTSAIQSHVKEIDSINDKAQKLEDEVAAYGQSKEAIEALTTARMMDRIEVLKGFDGSSEEIARIEETIAARKRLAAAGAAKDQKDANKKAAEDAAKEWQKTADEINRTVTDSLMRAFENGEGFAHAFAKTVEAMFKTMVLRPVVSAVVTPLSEAVSSAIGFSGGPQNAGGLFKAADLFSSGKSLADMFNSGFTSIGNSVGQMFANFATSGAGQSLGLSSLVSTGPPTAAGVAAQAVPTMTANANAAATSLSSAVSGAIPVLAAASLFASMFERGSHYFNSTGETNIQFDRSGGIASKAAYRYGQDTIFAGEVLKDPLADFHQRNNANADAFATALNKSYLDAAKAIGAKAVETTIGFGSNDFESATGQGNFRIGLSAGAKSFNTGEVAASDEAIKLAASRAVFTALQGSELPKAIAGIFDSLDAAKLSQDQINTALESAKAFKGLHDSMAQLPFENLRDLTYEATKGLLEFSGGMDKFTQNLGTYYDNFYSAEEKRDQTLKNITQTLTDAGALTKTTRTAIPGEFDVRLGAMGDARLEQRYSTTSEAIDMPKTREEFRKLAETLAQSMKDLGGEDTQKAYAAVLSVSGAFASVVPAATDATAALKKDAEARASWQQKLDLLTGKTTESAVSLQNDLASATDSVTGKINATTESLIRQVHAQQDLAAATEKSSASLKAITTANQSIALSKATLAGASSQDTSLTAANYALQNSIAALDAFKERITGKDQNVTKAEIESVNLSDYAKTEFIGELADLMKGYWDAKAGVKSAQDAIDKANKDAQQAIDDKAAQDAKQRADAIGQERAGLQSQLDQLTMTSTQLLEKQRAALDESNRALFDNIQVQTAWKAINTQHAELQDRLNIANGTITARQAALQKELAGALDATSTSMIKAIYAAEDQAAANEKAAAAAKEQADAAAAQAKQLADEAIARAKALADTNKGWRDQLDVLTGAQTERSIALRDALDESTRALMRQVYAQQDLKSAVEASATASDTALGGIQKALDAQKTAQTQAVNDVKGLFDLLSQSVKDLYGQVDSTRAQSAAEGSAFIATAAALAKAGGALPDEAKLRDAIGAASSGINATQFASQRDADFARLALAGQLSQIQEVAGTKLTDAQALLETTNNAYETAKAQLDTLRGINDSTLSVAAAVEAFQVAYTGEATARQKLLASAQQVNATVGGRSQEQADRDPGNIAAAKSWAASRIDNLVAYAAAGGNMDGARVAAEVVALQHYINDPSATQRLPSFDVGTNYVPRDLVAQLHEGEAVVPKAYNPAAGGNARLEALVEGLTKEVQRLQAIVNDGNANTRRTADAVNGNPEMPMLVQTAV